jgi:pimeloyl-ACP methyl ester carboxylesterase
MPLLWATLLGACSPERAYHAALVLEDIGAGHAPSSWKGATTTPERHTVTYTVDTRQRRSDLYLPADGPPQAGIVMVAGVVPLGNRDPRLIAFAETLARARFAVLAPEMPGFRALQVSPQDPRIVADAVAHLADRPDLAPEGRLGIAAFSFSVGLALLAALEEDVRNRVQFVLGIGGYYDLPATIAYFTTGYMTLDGEREYLAPDPYGKLIFARSSLPYLSDLRDRKTLAEMVRRRLEDPAADIASLAPRLGSEGGAVYGLLTNTDPDRVPALIGSLPPGIRQLIVALSLHNKDLSHLKARLILVHGKDDVIIPYTQSIALARALPSEQVELFVIEHVLRHVELRPRTVLSWSFWTTDVPDFWRLHQAIYTLLGERVSREEPQTPPPP